MALTIDQLNTASATDAVALLDGIYEHSPWVAEAALAEREADTLAQLGFDATTPSGGILTMRAALGDRAVTLLQIDPELEPELERV